MTTVPFRRKASAAGLVAALQSDEHAPMSAMIEIADRCNEVCVHCYQVQGQKGEMSTDEVKRVLDELAEIGVIFLTISGGEPTLRKDFLEIVEHARAKRFAVKIYTNGLNMTRELAARLAELAVQEVQISLYSHRAEVHDWVTRVPGAFERTVQGAKWLREAGVAVVLKSPIMSFNAAEYREWIDFVVGLGCDYALDPHLDPREDGDRAPEALRIDDATFLRVRRDPRLGGPKQIETEPRPKRLDESLCGACSGNVHIEANGEIRPCTQMTVPVGHALRDGVQKAWDEHEDGRMIRELTWRDIHGCRDCDLQPYCGRCFANAQMEGGDALGPYRAACHAARLGFELARGVAPRVLEAKGGRDGKVGPYREVEPGALLPIEDVMTARDQAVAERYGWVRASAGPEPAERVSPGQLVQIRRPGRRRAKLERVPGPSRNEGEAEAGAWFDASSTDALDV